MTINEYCEDDLVKLLRDSLDFDVKILNNRDIQDYKPGKEKEWIIRYHDYNSIDLCYTNKGEYDIIFGTSNFGEFAFLNIRAESSRRKFSEIYITRMAQRVKEQAPEFSGFIFSLSKELAKKYDEAYPDVVVNLNHDTHNDENIRSLENNDNN